MDSIRSSMTAVAADLIFSAPPSSPMESKFWSRSAVPSSAYNNIKSEGSFTSSSPTTLVNTNSSSGSCLASLMQVMDQSGKYNQPFTSDSMELVGVDQVAKCGFSTVTSTHRNQYSKPGLDNILDDPSMGLNTPSAELDSVWRLPYTSCWNPQTQRQEEFRSELPAQSSKPAGVCRFSSEISDDSSLDGCLPASSTVSSASDGLADHGDDVYVDGSSTSVELPSVSNFTLNSPRVLQQPIIAFPSTCSEGSTLSTGEIRSRGLDNPLVELDSRLVDQTLALGVDEEQKSSSTGNLELGNDGNILLVQPQLQDPKQPNDGQETPTSRELKWKHAPPSLDVNENWSTKRLKPSPPSSPTSPAALQVAFPVPNLNGLNGNPPTPGPSPSSSPRPPLSPTFLMRNTTAPSVYQLPQHPTVASLGGSADLTKVPGPTGTSPKAPFMAPHQFLFGANFPSLVNIDIREIENSRPKRRNVKISKDPQSVAARHRRERISDRIRVLQRLVPGGTKMDTASMLDEAISYVKYLKLQVQTLESCGNAGFDPRMQFPAAYYLPVRPVQGDCSTVSQIAPGVAPDHGMYGASLGQSAIKFPDVYREQFCH